MKRHLLVIDPQNDFVDPNGSLHVPGAEEDISRLTQLVERSGGDLDDIHVTLDSHREIDIAHPIFWVGGDGQPPPPFTTITADDLEKGRWRPRIADWTPRVRDYLEKLSTNGRYDLTIWPPHCIIGSWGHAVFPVFSDALRDWERKHFAIVDYVTKGSNIFTEHYSAVKAEVEDAGDPTTQLNGRLIDLLQDPQVGEIWIAGEALSHCVANTVRDIAKHFGEENIRKFVLLSDCSSSVPGCEKMGEDFVVEMKQRGMKVAKSSEVWGASAA